MTIVRRLVFFATSVDKVNIKNGRRKQGRNDVNIIIIRLPFLLVAFVHVSLSHSHMFVVSRFAFVISPLPFLDTRHNLFAPLLAQPVRTKRSLCTRVHSTTKPIFVATPMVSMHNICLVQSLTVGLPIRQHLGRSGMYMYL